MPTPKTIQIFLPDGEPQGLRTAEMTTRIVQVIDVPRKMLPQFRAMPESGQVGVYYLVGESEAGGPLAYVGQTGDLRGRLAAHNRQKDFWRRALVVVSRTNTLTQTHGLLLEWLSIAAVREAGRYADDNGTAGGEPHAPPPLRAECEEFFETIGPLLATLGHPLFEPVAGRVTPEDDASPVPATTDVYECTARSSDARGRYTSEGFVVLAGSSGLSDIPPSAEGKSMDVARRELLAAGVLTASGDRLVFARDHLFGSPSGAASTVMGLPTNGWDRWTTPDGRTLDEVERRESAD